MADRVRRAARALSEAWRRLFNARFIDGLNVLIALLVAATSALGSLVVEDLLPLSAETAWHIEAARGWWLVGLTVALGVVVWVRSGVHRYAGALYYVRILDDQMTDRHDQARISAQRRRMGMKTVSRWADLRSRTTDGVIDVADVCEDVSRSLELVVNNEPGDYGRAIAPNVLWPAALAIGAELPLVDRWEMVEFLNNGDEISFRLDEHRDMFGEKLGDTGAPGTGAVGVILAFTPYCKDFDEKEAFGSLAISNWHRLAPRDVSGREHSGVLTGEEIGALAEPVAARLAAIKREASQTGRELVVAARMPKALALAVGWHLGCKEVRFFAGTHLLHFDSEQRQRFSVRVHRAQPISPPLAKAHPIG